MIKNKFTVTRLTDYEIYIPTDSNNKFSPLITYNSNEAIWVKPDAKSLITKAGKITTRVNMKSFVFFKGVLQENVNADVVILLSSNRPCSLWINDELICVKKDEEYQIVKFRINTTETEFVIGFLSLELNDWFGVRISDLSYEQQDFPASLLCNILEHKRDYFHAIQFMNSEDTLDKCFCFMITCNNWINLDLSQDIIIDIESGLHIGFKKRIKTKLFLLNLLKFSDVSITDIAKKNNCYETNNINICNFQSYNVDEIGFLCIRVTYTDGAGEQKSFDKLLFDLSYCESNIVMQIDNLSAKSNELTYIKSIINKIDKKHILYEFTMASAMLGVYSLKYLRECTTKFLDSSMYIIENPEIKRVYLNSKLDNSIQQLDYILSYKNYNNEKIPLILSFPIYMPDVNKIVDYATIVPETTMIVNVPLRGVTLDNRIGEAQAIEVLDYMITNYREILDLERIYIIGCCAGATTGIELVKRYPNRFAGILAIEPMINKNEFINLTDSRCTILLSSEQQIDYIQKPSEMQQLEILTSSDMFIDEMAALLHKVTYITKLIQSIKKHPNKLTYRYSLDAFFNHYWIENIRLDTTSEYGLINACYTDKGIDIICESCIGFSIRVMPSLLCENAVLCVNRKAIGILNPKCDIYHIVLENGYPSLTNNMVIPTFWANFYDVYASPLSIWSNSSENEIGDIIRIFSSPITNTWDKKIYIDYHINYFKKVNAEIGDNKILFIDTLKDYDYLYDNDTQICIFPDRVQYLTNEYIGSYCLMDVIECKNIEGINQIILRISYNNVRMLRDNFFVKRFFISTNILSKNEFYNSKAILFWNDRYFIIKKWGNAHEEI